MNFSDHTLDERAALILNRFYLDDPDCDPAFRGLGRFMRNMREAGFGGLQRDPDIIAVDSITQFTRYRGDVCAYALNILSRDVNHACQLVRAFEILELPDWTSGAVAIDQFVRRLGSSGAIIAAAEDRRPQMQMLTDFMQARDVEAMSARRADWLRSRPEARIVPEKAYDCVLRSHISSLRKAA